MLNMSTSSKAGLTPLAVDHNERILRPESLSLSLTYHEFDIFVVCTPLDDLNHTACALFPTSTFQELWSHHYSTSSTCKTAWLQTQPLTASHQHEDTLAVESRPSNSSTSVEQQQSQVLKTPKMHRPCLELSCSKHASFNMEDLSRPIYCKAHKLSGMVNVRSKTCEAKDCSTRPGYNLPGQSVGRFCVKHKLPSMVDVLSMQCENDLCTTKPHFNATGEARGRFCFLHQQAGMVDVFKRECHNEMCTSRPYFNFKGESVGLFCAKHRWQGMIDVLSKLCEADGCSKYPTFGVKGTKHRRFCIVHREPAMISLSRSQPQRLMER